jgi:chaperone modulatory protein CbpM
MINKITYEVTEIIEIYKLNEIFIYDCIEREWIIPVDLNKMLLDDEDIGRILLIKDLKEDFGVNDEGVPIILHLIDQLHWSQSKFKQFIKKSG